MVKKTNKIYILYTCYVNMYRHRHTCHIYIMYIQCLCWSSQHAVLRARENCLQIGILLAATRATTETFRHNCGRGFPQREWYSRVLILFIIYGSSLFVPTCVCRCPCLKCAYRYLPTFILGWNLYVIIYYSM